MVQLALSKGDQKAYAELLQRYRESVYFMMLKMVNNKDDADDLTIEAFGRAFKKLDQYTPNYAFSTWLFKIASNNAIDFLRKKKLNNTISMDTRNENSDYDASNLVRSTHLNPEEFYIKKQKVEMVRAVIDKLKPKYKELVELFYFQELSHEEISEKLNLPIGTIKAQLFRARDFLFELIKNSEHNKK
ncbi:MAG: sigma-70 family RNA polymerase sigma factor [Sphingobacteriaceae bacterium]|nr:sigma-70 family RNA polymerase sigma factor [Sphingobacteriaceae bacterium]MBK7310880.1 sigma-70 family RNA polymerase sigma factor [Sphingobacteriaceae bacterium]